MRSPHCLFINNHKKIHLKLTQHCKSTILQYKIKIKLKKLFTRSYSVIKTILLGYKVHTHTHLDLKNQLISTNTELWFKQDCKFFFCHRLRSTTVRPLNSFQGLKRRKIEDKALKQLGKIRSSSSPMLTMFLKWALRVPVAWWYSITQQLFKISPL